MSTVENPEWSRNVKPLKTRSDTTHKSQQLTHRRRRVKKYTHHLCMDLWAPLPAYPVNKPGFGH